MKTLNIVCAVGAAALLAGACNQPEETATTPADDTAMTDPMTPADTGMGAGTGDMTLGMTNAQLEDADVVSADGADLGDVERVVTDDTGQVTGLAVRVEGAADGEYVLLPTAGLTTRADGMDNDVQTTMTVEDLRGLPAWTPETTGSM